jgi:hypothetical protein
MKQYRGNGRALSSVIWLIQHRPDDLFVLKTILAGPYLANQYQYRRICYGTFDGSTVSSSTDPSNPFTNDDVVQFLTTLFNDNTLPDPRTHPQMFYCVIMPAKVHSDQWSATDPDKKLVGEHSYFVYGSPNPVNVHYAWVSDEHNNWL